MLRNNFPVTKLDGYPDILAATQLVQQSKPGEISIGGATYPFCSLVVDTLGEMGRSIEKSVKGAKEQATLPEWYLTVERMRNITRNLRDQCDRGLNIVFLCHEQYQKEAESSIILGVPDLPGRELPNDLPKLCDIVAHMKWTQGANGLIRRLEAVPSGVFIGRDRRGKIKSLDIDLTNADKLEELIVKDGGALHNCRKAA